MTIASPRAPVPVAGRQAPHGLRVLEVCGVHQGGAAQHVLDLSRGLAERGWSVHLCAPPGWLADQAGGALAGVWTASFVRRVDPFADARALRAISGLMRRLRPDLVHVHSSKAGALGRAAARRRALPTLFTPHAWSFLSASSAVERALWARTERLLAGDGRGIVCVSEHERLQGVAAGVLAPGAGHVIPNGVTVPDEPAPVQRESPVIGTLARLSRQKGIDVLLRAMAIVARRRPDVTLRIVGGGPLERELRALARRLGLERRVEFLGWIDDARPLLRELDVFVLASRWEGMPIALLEARAAGLPAVATDVGGAREVIRDGEDGWVVPREDPAALATALLDLADDRARRADWGMRARADVAARHGVGEMVRRTELQYLERIALAERHG